MCVSPVRFIPTRCLIRHPVSIVLPSAEVLSLQKLRVSFNFAEVHTSPKKNLPWHSDSLPSVTWSSLFMFRLERKLVLLGADFTYQRNAVLREKEEHLFSEFSDSDRQGYKEKKEFLFLLFFRLERQIVTSSLSCIAICPLMKALMSQLSGDRVKFFSNFYYSSSELLSPRCGELDSCILLCKVVLKNFWYYSSGHYVETLEVGFFFCNSTCYGPD